MRSGTRSQSGFLVEIVNPSATPASASRFFTRTEVGTLLLQVQAAVRRSGAPQAAWMYLTPMTRQAKEEVPDKSQISLGQVFDLQRPALDLQRLVHNVPYCPWGGPAMETR